MAADDAGDGPRVLRVEVPAELTRVLDEAGLAGTAPALVLVGGAAGLAGEVGLTAAFAEGIVPAVVACGAAVLDGGTDSGVMALIGAARRSAGATFPLVGVAARGTVATGSAADRRGAVRPAGGHSHLVLVPGDDWGDESSWLSAAASVVAGGRPMVTLLANGGPISRNDIRYGRAAGRPLVVLAGTGRLADEVADAAEVAPTRMVHVVPVAEVGGLRELLIDLLSGGRT